MVYLLWMMFILPWLSLFFIKKHVLKKLMPVSIFSALLVTIIFEIGYVYKWWIIEETITPWGSITSVPLVYGIFPVGTIWIIYYTFDKGFWVYFFTNVIMDAMYSFIGLNILTFFGVYELKNMGNLGIFLLMLFLALIVYPYHKWQVTIMKEE